MWWVVLNFNFVTLPLFLLLLIFESTICFQSIGISTGILFQQQQQQQQYQTPNNLWPFSIRHRQQHQQHHHHQQQQQRLYKKDQKRLVRQQYENNLNVYNHKFITPSNNIPRRRMKVLLKSYYTPTLFVQGNRDYTKTKDDDATTTTVAATQQTHLDINLDDDDDDIIKKNSSHINYHLTHNKGKVLNPFVFDDNTKTNNDFLVLPPPSFDCKKEEQQQEEEQQNCQCKYGCNGNNNFDLEERLQMIVRKSIDDFVVTPPTSTSTPNNNILSSSTLSKAAEQEQEQQPSKDYFLFDYRCALLHISARKALKKGKLSTARNFYKLFLYEWSGDRLDTSIAHTYFLWALLEQRAKDFNMARSLFIEATSRFPDHPRLLQGWALMESKCGNIDLAKELIFKAVKIDPNFLPLLKWKIFRITKEEMVRLGQENKINDTLYEIKDKTKKYSRKRFYRKKKETIVCKQSKLPI